MKARVAVTAVCCALALLFVAPTAGLAKRGLPDYVDEKHCGDNNTGPSVLLAFATNYGSTYRVADVIAAVLCAQGYKVDLRFAKNVTDAQLATYDAVILGSCIYIERWHPDAIAFLADHKATLATMPTAYYCVCGLLGVDFIPDPEELAQESYLNPMMPPYENGKGEVVYPEIVGTTPLDVKGFAGVVDYSILKPVDWLLLHLMFMPKGHFTDYAEVVNWSYEIIGMLQ